MNESDTYSSVFVGGGREQKEERLNLFCFLSCWHRKAASYHVSAKARPGPGQGQAAWLRVQWHQKVKFKQMCELG